MTSLHPDSLRTWPGTSIRGDGSTYQFGQIVYPPGGRFGPRIQSAFQLVILVQGSLAVTVNQQIHHLAPGEALLQCPGGHEQYRFSSEVKSAHLWCQVFPAHLSTAERKLLRRVPGVHAAAPFLHQLIREGLAILSPHKTDLHLSGHALARACLLRFAASALSATEQDLSPPPHPALARIRELAVRDYAQLKSAAELARKAGISISRLNAICREAGSESPRALLWRLKVEHALQLIRSTGLPLSEIAEACGYANAFHLSRSVRRHAGYSPRQLRQKENGGKKAG